MEISKNVKKCYEDLANAIIVQAVEDLKFYLSHRDYANVDYLRKWFCGEVNGKIPFIVLTNINGKYLFDSIANQYKHRIA